MLFAPSKMFKVLDENDEDLGLKLLLAIKQLLNTDLGL